MTRKSTHIAFPGGRGEALSGILDLPAESAPRAFGVFGPCFTCPKESHGAAKICRALAERGVAMLRFDPAGTGMSKGDPSEATFTDRIGDMVAAARALEQLHQAPRLLMGHSISGTAALSAAKHVPTAEIVATVGSPADTQTVIEKFRKGGHLKELGEMVELSVLGRPHAFKKEFVDDMLEQTTAEDTAALKAKLLVFHAPHDNIVLYRNAEIIASRAKNAELITLDEAATHLFEKRDDDAVFIAENIARRF